MRRSILLLILASAAALGAVTAAEPAYANSPAPVVDFGSGKCLQPVPNVDPGNPVDIFSNGISVEQVTCNGSPEQKWLPIWLFNANDPLTGGGGLGFPPLEPVYYMINYLTSKCMDVTDGNPNRGARIQQWDCNGGNSEKWFQHPGILGYIKYVNYRTSKCLDVPGAAVDQITMQQWNCFGDDNVAQLFTFPA
jgi:hypothetical protein